MTDIRPFRAYALAIASFAMTFWNCSKNGNTGPGGGEQTGTDTTSLYGLIRDEAGLPLAGVVVTAGSAADTTGADGLFALPSAKVPKGRAVILARKTGYFDGSRAEPVGGSGGTRMQLSMMKKAFSHTVSGSAGGTVAVAKDASVEFPAGGFATASGNPYTGSVKIAARYLHPDSSDFYSFFSGDNAGQAADGSTVGLMSLGVLRVDVQGSAGEALKLKAGAPATLKFGKPASAADAPAAIPLWYYDTELGKWREEGKATLENGVYVGTVSHFTDWNLDYKLGETWDFYVRVLCDTLTVQGVAVRVYQKLGYSDREGLIHFINAPADMAVNKLEILASDNDGRFFRNAPIDMSVRKGDTIEVKLDSKCPTFLFGALAGCSGDSIPGLAALTLGDGIFYDYTLDGRFFFFAPAGEPLILNASDQQNNKLTPPMALAPLGASEQRNLGLVKICGTRDSTWLDIKPDSVDFIQEWAVSPNTTRLAYSMGSGSLILLDAATGNLIEKIDVGKEEHTAGEIQFSDDAARMLTGTHAPAAAHLWDVSAKPARRVTSIPGYTHYELAADGKTVFATGAPGVNLLSATDGSVLKTYHPALYKPGTELDGVHPIKWLQGDDAIIYERSDSLGIFRVWSLATDTQVRDIRTVPVTDHFGYHFNFSQDGGLFYVSTDFMVAQIFSSATGERIDSLAAGQQTDEGKGIHIHLTPSFLFKIFEIADVKVIQQFKLGGREVLATLPTPIFPGGPNPRVGFPAISKDEKRLTVEVRYPATRDRSTVSGWRIYKLD